MCFNFTCTPTKQKKTLDYILDWIKINGPILQKDTEDIAVLKAWKEEVSDDYIKAQIDAAVAEYDWSTVPEFEAKIDKVPDAVENDFASFDDEGNIIDSGCNYDTFALAQHSHSEIKEVHKGSGNVMDRSASVITNVGEEAGDQNIVFRLYHKIAGITVSKEATIDLENIDNLIRALSDPDEAPTQDSDGLITSGGVYTALDNKNYIVNHNSTGNKSIAIDDDGEISVSADYINLTLNGDSQDIEIHGSDGDNIRRALHDPDNVATEDSNNLITSGGVYTSLQNKANKTKEIYIEVDSVNGYCSLGSNFADFTSALSETKSNPNLLTIKIRRVVGETVDHNPIYEYYKTTGSGYYEITGEHSQDDYDLTATIYVDGYVLKLDGQDYYGSITWDQNFSVSSNTIFHGI